MKKEPVDIDGLFVIEEYLLTKGVEIVSQDMRIMFKPLIDFGVIVYGLKVNSTNRMSMKFDLERFFMRRCLGELSGNETKYIRVPQEIYDKVKVINDRYKSDK